MGPIKRKYSLEFKLQETNKATDTPKTITDATNTTTDVTKMITDVTEMTTDK